MRPITAFRSPCMTLCASSSPNRPARPARTQKPPRASRLLWECAARCICSAAPLRVIERHTAAPAFPLLPVFFPPKLSGQITPTRQPQHFVPPHDFLTKRKSRRAIPAFLRDCAAVRHIDYAFASVSMAWANILTLSMNFSQSTYSSGIWQVSVSPGKLMPNATVLGIMRE